MDSLTPKEIPIKPGDILWVRETWKQATADPAGGGAALEDIILYKADVPQDYSGMLVEEKWHPSIHIPKEAARIFLRVKDVRVERLQDITQQQAIAEGFPSRICEAIGYKYKTDDGKIHTQRGIELCVVDFVQLWNSTIKPADLPKYGWNANPWVWVIEFERIEKPEGW